MMGPEHCPRHNSLFSFIRFGWLLSVLWGWCQLAAAGEGLQFTLPQQEFHPGETEETLTVSFAYSNQADRAITVLRTTPSCGCTTAAFDHATIQPKESGTMTAVVALSGLGGTQTKTIQVVTTETEHPQQTLSIVIVLPPSPICTPALVTWTIGDELTPRTIAIAYPSAMTPRISVAVSSDTRLLVGLVPNADQSGALLTITPTHTDSPISAFIELRSGTLLRSRVFAQVSTHSEGVIAHPPTSAK